MEWASQGSQRLRGLHLSRILILVLGKPTPCGVRPPGHVALMWPFLLHSSLLSQVLPPGETTVTSVGFRPACPEVSLLEPWLAAEE